MMTKSTSKKIALLKKVAVVPILAGLIYFFCIEVVAQEKIISMNQEAVSAEAINDVKLDNSAISDKRRDTYYSGVYVKIKDVKKDTIIKINKMYEELTLKEKRQYLSWVPEKINPKKVSEELFNKLSNTDKEAVWIDGKAIKNSELKKYKPSDFKYYTNRFIDKRVRLKQFPQEYQYTLYTNDYFDKYLKNNHLKFENDTLRMGMMDYQLAVKNKIKKGVKAETKVKQTEVKEGYNLSLNEKKEKKVIVIDAGHGGQDFGATKDELNEKNLTSEIAKRIKEMHSDSDVEIHFTRTNDEFIALNERTNLINNIKPDLVISLHINKSKNANSSGFEVYISDKTDFLDKNKEFAEKLSSKLSKTQLKNRGLKTAPFWILKNSICPSMVVELGFISNENDRNFITSEKGQTEIAKHIVAFISEVN